MPERELGAGIDVSGGRNLAPAGWSVRRSTRRRRPAPSPRVARWRRRSRRRGVRRPRWTSGPEPVASGSRPRRHAPFAARARRCHRRPRAGPVARACATHARRARAESARAAQMTWARLRRPPPAPRSSAHAHRSCSSGADGCVGRRSASFRSILTGGVARRCRLVERLRSAGGPRSIWAPQPVREVGAQFPD